nr:hypothetical protein [Pseudomonas sp.]
MGHRDLPCAIHSPYVDALHDTLHDSVPLVSPSEAVREVRAALLSSDRTAFEYSREAWVEAFLNMPEEDLGKLLYALLDPERDAHVIRWFSVAMAGKAWRIANDQEHV